MIIYCSGIGGIGLSAYAALQRANGHVVRGSDRADSPLVEDLRSQGIDVFLEQDGSHVTPDIDLFVYSEAIPEASPERLKATELGLPQQSYFHALGDLSEPYDVIAVCGTHGKSSTTAMIAKVLIDAGLDPTVVVGTKSPDLEGRNWRKGASKIFVVEACEYRRSFHFLSPDIVALTTIDGDHFDAFTSIDDYRSAFVEFFKRMPAGQPIFIHGEDPAARETAAKSGYRVIDVDSGMLPTVGVPGEHMRQNARLALGVARELGVDEQTALRSLAAFRGTWRRMEIKGETASGVMVIDDYAHHPAEIRATLQGIREAYPDRRIVCVFQPHTHDRTVKLYDEFVSSFSAADVVVIPNIYAARREVDASETVDVARFAADIARESGNEALDGGGLEATEKWLRTGLNRNDVLVIMGAGDVTELGNAVLA